MPRMTGEFDEAAAAAKTAGRLRGERGPDSWRKTQALATIALAAEVAELRRVVACGLDPQVASVLPSDTDPERS